MKRLDYNAAKNTTQNIKYKQNILKAEKKEAHSQSEQQTLAKRTKNLLYASSYLQTVKKKKIRLNDHTHWGGCCVNSIFAPWRCQVCGS